MYNTRRWGGVTAAVAATLLLVSCSSTAPGNNGITTPASTGSAPSTTASQPVTLKFAEVLPANSPAIAKMQQAVKDKFNVDLQWVDMTEAKYDEKLKLSLLSGTSDLDFFYTTTPGFPVYLKADVVAPLADLASRAGIDLQATFGPNLTQQGGQSYVLPTTKDVWMTLYNKKIFDDAGVPYPSADGWTWSKYVDTAQKLTNAAAGVYGSSMTVEWDSYKYMLAHQNGATDYKADGTANFDDPKFAAAMSFLNDLVNVKGIQPDFLTYSSKQIPYDVFTTGKYAMSVNGGWTSTFVADTTTYPRDWKYGILPMPYPDGAQPTSLSVVGGYALNKDSKNLDLAFKVAEYLAEVDYTLNPNRMPTVQNLSPDDLKAWITNAYIKGHESDGVTADDYVKAWFNPGITLINEKVVGTGAPEINQAFVDEGQLYLLGNQDLATTMANIQAKANQAIKNAS